MIAESDGNFTARAPHVTYARRRLCCHDLYRRNASRNAPYCPVTGGSFTGARFSGIVSGGADWVAHRPDSVMSVDVRLTLNTIDDVAIYLAYTGRFLAAPEAMARFGRGAQLDAAEYSLTISAKFECGDARYAWLNNVVAVGLGQQTPTGVIYQIFEVG
jgi:hypothetical protein